MTRSASGRKRSSWVATTTRRPGAAISRSSFSTSSTCRVIEMRGRLVGDDQRGVVDERPCDRNPLLLAPRQLSRPVPDPLGKPDTLDQLLGAFSGLGAWDLGQSHRGHHVLERCQAGDQVEGLEDDPTRAGGNR